MVSVEVFLYARVRKTHRSKFNKVAKRSAVTQIGMHSPHYLVLTRFLTSALLSHITLLFMYACPLALFLA